MATEACIDSIAVFLPEKEIDNVSLSSLFPEWSSDKIFEKTGIRKRHISGMDECSSDLAEKAAKRLIYEQKIDPSSIDFLIFVSQSPDYFLPTTACMLQSRIGIPKTAGAFDINLGCSGFIYGLAVAKGLIRADIAKRVLLLTAETYSKHMHPMDKSVRTIFGDGAAATLVSSSESLGIGAFSLGTDGDGWKHLIVPAGGMRLPRTLETEKETMDDTGNVRSDNTLYMNGPEIFNFTIDMVPPLIESTLLKNGLIMDDIDLFVFHQANAYILEFLRKRVKIPREKFFVDLEESGNTVSATIPIALSSAEDKGMLKHGMKVMLVGFGVGLSWGATVIKW